MHPSTFRTPRLLPLFLCALVLIGSFCARSALAAPVTSLRLHSEPGDYVGAGLDYLYTTSNGTFNVQRNVRNGVTVTFTTFSGSSWVMDFAAPNNAAPAPGVWLNALTFSTGDPSHAGLNVAGLGRSCTQVTGSVQVKQVTYGATGNVTAFWAVFAQQCDGSQASLTGDIRFRADLPVSVTSPPVFTVVRGQEVFFDVQAASSSTAALSLTADALPGGASFVDNGDRTGSFDWLTRPDQLGDHVLTFRARNTAGARDSAFTLVHVTGITGLRTESDPSDPVGLGVPSDIPGDAGTFAAGELNGAVTVTVESPDKSDVWSLTFSGPDGAPLSVGDYPNAAGPSPGPGQPGLFVTVNGRSCGSLSGEFQVMELVRDASGLRTFRASFEQNCDGADGSLRGDIRWNAAVPIDITAPLGLTVLAGQNVSFIVMAQDPFFSSLVLGGSPLPPGSSFLDLGDNSGHFTWTPGNAAAGLHVITFSATDGSGHTETCTTRLHVVSTAVPPVADAGGPYAGAAGAAVSFNGSATTSTDPIVSTTWDFGDGGTAAGLTPSHVYASAGSYTVRLVVCTAIFCDTSATVAVITPPPPPPPVPPVANAGGPYAGEVGSPVSFNGAGSTSTDPIVSAAWTFGDGGSASGLNASHTYAGPGTFTVRLVVCTAALCDTDIAVATITPPPPPPPEPPVAIAGGPYAAEAGKMISFDGSGSKSADPIVSALWIFGDGMTGSGLTVVHAYGSAGKYVVRLTVCTASLCDTDTTVAVITSPPPPVAAQVRAFATPGNNPFRLNSQRPHYEINFEPLASSWTLGQIDPASVFLFANGTGDVDRIPAVSVIPTANVDADHNKVPDLEASFSAGDLRRLTSRLIGTTTVSFRLEGRLTNGATLRAEVTIEVQPSIQKLGKKADGTTGAIFFTLSSPGFVSVRLYDISGRHVATLLEDNLSEGSYGVDLPSRTSEGRALAGGVYFYRVESPDGAFGGRVTLVR